MPKLRLLTIIFLLPTLLHAQDTTYAERLGYPKGARAMGFEPTHLDTHMGTVYATPQFLMAYIQLGIKNLIPVMLPGGADKLIIQQGSLTAQQAPGIRTLGKQLWNAGLA